MADEYKFPTALETLSADYWFPKFVMGGVLLYPAYDSFSVEHPASIFGSILLFSLSFTFLWLTRIKPEAEELKYRRLFQWKSLPYSQIIDCKTSWVWGRIKTKQYNFPFGGIYFVLPRDRKYDYRWDKEIISYIRSKAGLSDPTQ